MGAYGNYDDHVIKGIWAKISKAIEAGEIIHVHRVVPDGMILLEELPTCSRRAKYLLDRKKGSTPRRERYS